MKRKSNCFVTILFLIYLALLVWIILFKLQFSISDLDKIRSINLIPFHYDKEIGAAFHLTEVLENFLIFVPMGIYLQMLLPRTKLYVKFMLIAGTSFLLETMGDVTMDDAGVPLLTIDARDGSVIQRIQAGWATSMGSKDIK